VVMLARSRLAINFCALNSFQDVGVEIRWDVSLRLPTRPLLASEMPEIPYADLRSNNCRPGAGRGPVPLLLIWPLAFHEKRKGNRCFALEAPLSLPTGTRPAKGNAYMDVRIRRGEAGTPNLAAP